MQSILSAANGSQPHELGISLENGNKLRVHFQSPSPIHLDIGRNLADGLWHHAVISRNAGTGNVSLYLDGGEVGPIQNSPLGSLEVEAVVVGQKHLTLASYAANHAFSGRLDDLRIYSVGLAPAQALELFRPNDLDRDGLPDDWELSLFDNLATLTDAMDDLDGDGLTNREEFEGGTDPNDYYNGIAPVIEVIAGQNQEIYNGERTREPLVFRVTQAGTSPPVPLVGAPVTLAHLGLLGSVQTLDGDLLASSLTLKTDSNGEVAVHFKAD